PSAHRRHEHAHARPVVAPAVVRALEHLTGHARPRQGDHVAGRQPRAPVRAAVGERGDGAVETDHRVRRTQQQHPVRRRADLGRQRYRVPEGPQPRALVVDSHRPNLPLPQPAIRWRTVATRPSKPARSTGAGSTYECSVTTPAYGPWRTTVTHV